MIGMTIEEIIKYLPAPICGSTDISEEKQKEYNARDAAIKIMRKYQRIKEIIDNWTKPEELEWAIREVLEDGKDN